jgi:hypothetical protein
MNMKEPQQQTLQTDEEVTLVVSGEEATLVSPRFDDEETLVARPVVPLGGEAVEASTSNDVTPAVAVPPARTAYARSPYAPRRPWVLALVLVSVLVGGVLGGAGLYIYQRQSQDDGDATADATTPPATATDTQQPPLTAPTDGAAPAPLPTAQTQPETPAVETTDADAQPSEPDDDSATNGEPAARERETEPAVERRDANDDDDASAGTRKRGKKGEHDEDVERPRRRANRPDSDAPITRDDDTGAREARRVDTIVYRPRRAARRARRDAAGDTDRIRRIFEGTPE